MYDLEALNADLEQLKADGAKVFDIGKTEYGRNIPCVFKGNPEGAQVLVVASTHAREYITTPLVIQMMRDYSGSAGVWCVPMLNIDGALICQQGLSGVPERYKQFILSVNGGSEDFTAWKANGRAVDLNVNFNAKWGTGALNVTYPSPANYIGEYPVSESENIALRNLSLRIQPSVMLSYHTKGGVMFWGFECVKPYLDKAERISESTGYPVLESTGSAGGFKDWYTATEFKLGLTIEVGGAEYEYPLPMDILPQIYAENRDVLRISAEIAEEIG